MVNQIIKVSESAVVRRLKRKLLREDGIILKKCPQRSRSYPTLGDYYEVDANNNCTGGRGIDIETYARELGVLAIHEQMA